MPTVNDWQAALLATELKPPTLKHVALTLSLHADWDTGENAHPGAPRLADETGLVERTIRSALATLVDSGWLKLSARGGRTGGKSVANVYSLLIPRHAVRCTLSSDSPLQLATGTVSSDAPHPSGPSPVDSSPDNSRGDGPQVGEKSADNSGYPRAIRAELVAGNRRLEEVTPIPKKRKAVS